MLIILPLTSSLLITRLTAAVSWSFFPSVLIKQNVPVLLETVEAIVKTFPSGVCVPPLFSHEDKRRAAGSKRSSRGKM